MIFMSISVSADTYINDVSSPVGYENNAQWAGDRMFDWLNKGMISGYDNSSFRPDDAITKAEFIAIVNMVFGYHDTEFKTFDDVSESDWFYYDVAKAVRAGYVNPNESSFKPESKISREEVTVMLAKVLRIDAKSYSSAARKFKDYSKIASENRQFINAMVEMGYIGGYSDHTFRPKDPITRAETVAIFNKAVGRIYYDYGVYGPRSGAEVISTNVLVNQPDITLQNMTIYGNLYLSAGIADGEVELYNVKVQGKTIVQGGGEYSINLYNSEFKNLIVDKKDGRIKILTEGNSSVQTTHMESGGLLEEGRLTGTGFNDVFVESGQDIDLNGNFRDIRVKDSSMVKMKEFSEASKVTVDRGISKSYVDLDERAVIRTFVPNSSVDVKSKGSILNAYINTAGNRYDLSGYIDNLNLEANGYVVLDDGSYVTQLKTGTRASGASVYLGANGIMEKAMLYAPTVLDGGGNVYAAGINAPDVFIEHNVLDVNLKNGIPWAMVGGRKITESLIGGRTLTDIKAEEGKDKIVSVQKVDISILVGEKFDYPKTVTALMGDGNTQQRIVRWNKIEVNTDKVGSTSMTGTVEGYEGVALLTVIVKPLNAKPVDPDLVVTSGVSAIDKSTKEFTIRLAKEPTNDYVGKKLVLTRGIERIGATCTKVDANIMTFKIDADDISKLTKGVYNVVAPQDDRWIKLIGAQTSYGEADDVTYTIKILPGLTAFQRTVIVTLNTDNDKNYKVTVLGKELEYKEDKDYFIGLVDSSDEEAIRNGVVIINLKEDMPEYEVTLKSGLTAFQRYVEVVLATDNPEKYRVVVLGEELEFKNGKFVGLVNSSNEESIKGGVLISSK
jgi:hypothetical protein